MKEMGRQGRNHKQLLDNINEKKILEISTDRNLWKSRFRKSYGLDVRQTA